MNYEAERAMNQKRLRMEGEPGHGVVQGNGLPLNYMDNGHQISYQPYAGAYNTHYPPPEAFSPYGPPPPGGYAPQNLSYAPPAHQNYPHHQSFPPQQPPQPQLHMPQSHMVQSYSADIGVHKTPAWPPQPHLLTPLDAQKPLDIKHMKPEIKLEPSDSHKRPHADNEVMSELDQPKIKIKTDIFKPDELAHRPHTEKTHDVLQKPIETTQKIAESQSKDEGQPNVASEVKTGDKPAEPGKPEAALDAAGAAAGAEAGAGAAAGGERAAPLAQETLPAKSEDDRKPFSSPEQQKAATPGKIVSPGTEPKKRGRPKGSTNKPKSPGAAGAPGAGGAPRAPPAAPGAAGLGAPRGPPGVVGAGAGAGAGAAPSPRAAPAAGRPRGAAYQYAVRPFRKDFSGIQFRRRWSDDCLDSSHIPNEVYFGDVPVPPEVLHNYYDAHAERERLAAQAAHIAAQKAAQAKLAAARAHHHQQHQLQRAHEVTTVDSSSDSSSGSSGSDSDDSDDEQPLKRGPGRPKGSKNSSRRSSASVGSAGSGGGGGGGGRRGRPPVPPELRQPGVTDMKKFCKAAGIRFDYKKLVDGCTKNKERVAKMLELLVGAGLEGKPTLDACRALKAARQARRDADKLAKRDAAHARKHKDAPGASAGAGAGAGEAGGEGGAGAGAGEGRRMTRGATGVKPRQRIVISSDEEDGTPAARRTLSKLRSSLNDHSDTD